MRLCHCESVQTDKIHSSMFTRDQPYHQSIEDADADEDGNEFEMTRSQLVYAQIKARGKHWPKAIGVVEIITGVILVLLGVLEVFILPMIESTDGKNLILIDKQNCFGVGLYAGLVMVVTGNTALRATMSKRNTTVQRFFSLTILSVLVYTALTIILIVGYTNGWTSNDAYPPGSRRREAHMFVTMFTVLSLMFALSTLFQYWDVICCKINQNRGGMSDEDTDDDGADDGVAQPLWRVWLSCLCPYAVKREDQSWKRLSFDCSYQEELNNRSDPI